MPLITTANRIQFLIGWQGDAIDAINNQWGSNSSANVFQGTAVALNSTTVIATGVSGTSGSRSSLNGATFSAISMLRQEAPLGCNYVAPMEFSTASGTSTWYGDNGASVNTQSVFTMTTMF
jgi:hypothetical protein